MSRAFAYTSSFDFNTPSRILFYRAIYKEADIYLLDDPLSAVDSRVGKYLFENCIKGAYHFITTLKSHINRHTTTLYLSFRSRSADYLREKICVLVTHQIHFLTNVDQIVLMENVRIIIKVTLRARTS